MSLRSLAIAPLVLLALPAWTGTSADDEHAAEVEQWRQRRLASLTSETGWLTLTGLHPLHAGRQTLGSGPEADIELSAKAPASLGTVTVGDDSLRFDAAPDLEVTVDGEPMTSVELQTDREGPARLFEFGPLNFHVIQRDDLLLLRARDREHPARRQFEGIDSFPIDSAWRFEARFEAYEPIRQIPIANIIGQVSDSPSWGAVVFEHDGQTYRIDGLAEPGDEELFLIFGDETSGKETYGAGRYLYVDAPDAEGRVVLDFNRAYNPPCAFTPFATCPLPPPQNRLKLRIEAGERTYEAGH